MALHKDFYIETAEIEWNGRPVGTVRGVSADDIAKVCTENGSDLELVIQEIVDSGNYNLKDVNSIEDALGEKTNEIFNAVMRLAPRLVAKVIGVAMDAEPGDYATIQKMPAPLQTRIIREIARVSFVDRAGFKEFLGNVSALVTMAKSDTVMTESGQRQVSTDG